MTHRFFLCCFVKIREDPQVLRNDQKKKHTHDSHLPPLKRNAVNGRVSTRYGIRVQCVCVANFMTNYRLRIGFNQKSAIGLAEGKKGRKITEIELNLILNLITK